MCGTVSADRPTNSTRTVAAGTVAAAPALSHQAAAAIANSVTSVAGSAAFASARASVRLVEPFQQVPRGVPHAEVDREAEQRRQRGEDDWQHQQLQRRRDVAAGQVPQQETAGERQERPGRRGEAGGGGRPAAGRRGDQPAEQPRDLRHVERRRQRQHEPAADERFHRPQPRRRPGRLRVAGAEVPRRDQQEPDQRRHRRDEPRGQNCRRQQQVDRGEPNGPSPAEPGPEPCSCESAVERAVGHPGEGDADAQG